MKEKNSKHTIPNTKNSSGITLIALIITIIVLLIIAVVAIGAVQNSGIIAHAENAATGYNTKKGEENDAILSYETFIEDNLPEQTLEAVSIVGTYGYLGDSEGENCDYYVFNEDGTGEYNEWDEGDVSGPVLKRIFRYSLVDEKNGTIIIENGNKESEYRLKFEIVKDSSGNIINKAVIIFYDYEFDDSNSSLYTINGATGFQKIENTTYRLYEKDIYQQADITFDNNIITYKVTGSEQIFPVDWIQEYFKLGEYVYIQEKTSYSNCYFGRYRIDGDMLIDVAN